ncbi:MAG: hypothetical protein WCR06_11105 [bacterium]
MQKQLLATCVALAALVWGNMAGAQVTQSAPRPAAVGATTASGTAAASSVPVAAAPAAANPEAVRAEFNAILSHLDPGGDLMIIANTDGVIEELAATLRGFAKLIPTDPSGENPVVQAMDRLPAFIKASGLYAIDGLGVSMVPRNDGLNDLKMFVYRDPAAATLPLWQGLVGGAPKRLTTLEYLPADTVLVRAGTADPRQFWKLINDAVRNVGGTEAAQGFDAVMAEAAKNLGTNVNAVIASLDAEQFFSMQLSSSQTIQLPAGKAAGAEGLTIPSPSLLLGCTVRDATLITAIQRALQKEQVPILISTNGPTTLYSLGLPLPMPFPLSPTFAVHRNMFLFGSSTEIVRQAIAAAEGTGATRLKVLGSLTKPNNGVAYVDRRFSDTMMKVQSHYLQQSPGGGEMAGVMQLLQRQQACQASLILVNEKDGISTSGTTSQGGRQMVLGMTVMPVAMMSAIAIPSFMMARNQAMNARGRPPSGKSNPRSSPPDSSCVNNLRMIDRAKQQWALSNNKADADIPAATTILPFIKGGRMPVCPQGGVYSIKAVGESPACSIPGHKLAE